MRVLLINPYYPISETPSPPLGLAYLAGALETAGSEVQILDFVVFPYDRASLESYLDNYRPDAVGAAGDDVVPILHPGGKVASPSEGHIDLVDVVPGPVAEPLRLFLLHDEFLSLAKGGAGCHVGLAVFVGQILVEHHLEHGDFDLGHEAPPLMVATYDTQTRFLQENGFVSFLISPLYQSTHPLTCGLFAYRCSSSAQEGLPTPCCAAYIAELGAFRHIDLSRTLASR